MESAGGAESASGGAGSLAGGAGSLVEGAGSLLAGAEEPSLAGLGGAGAGSLGAELLVGGAGSLTDEAGLLADGSGSVVFSAEAGAGAAWLGVCVSVGAASFAGGSMGHSIGNSVMPNLSILSLCVSFLYQSVIALGPPQISVSLPVQPILHLLTALSMRVELFLSTSPQ